MDIDIDGGAPREVLALLDGETPCVRRSLGLLGTILTGADRRVEVTPQSFLTDHLGCELSEMLSESRSLSPTAAVVAGMQLAAMIERHGALTGPSNSGPRIEWRQLTVGDDRYSVPANVAAYFPADCAGGDIDVPDGGYIVRMYTSLIGDMVHLEVLTGPGDRSVAADILGWIYETARQLNPYRGRFLTATDGAYGLSYQVEPDPHQRRVDLVVPDHVWSAIDLCIAAVTTWRERLLSADLRAGGGLLLAGPPGVGKTAITRAVATELIGDFTIISLDGNSATHLLRQVYDETVELGPTVIIVDDIDLSLSKRGRGRDSALGDMLAMLDGVTKRPGVLTIASTNDPASLDPAVLRSGRFDTVIELGYPDHVAAQRILGRLLDRLDYGDRPSVDLGAVTRHLSQTLSGADLTEVVRKAVLVSGDGYPTTDDVIAVVRDGGWRAAPLTGNYL